MAPLLQYVDHLDPANLCSSSACQVASDNTYDLRDQTKVYVTQEHTAV